jgi:gas vesicle protein
MRSENGGSALWFVAGVAVGATVALLYAPQSGEDTRKKLRRKAERGRDYLEDRGKEFYRKGRELADEANDLFERGKKMVEG